jgi:hypothetical protein
MTGRRDWESYFQRTMNSLRENGSFAESNRVAKECSDELTELVNDAIDSLPFPANEGDNLSKSKLFCVGFNLTPSCYGIYLNFFAGNIPACFMQMRTAMEFMFECFLADKSYPEEKSLDNRLEMFQEKTQHISFSKLIDEEDSDAAKLWHKLSEWGHGRTLLKSIYPLAQIFGKVLPLLSWCHRNSIVPPSHSTRDVPILAGVSG